MKRKRVWRYYCEFCGKGGCSSGGMKRHEAHCIRNPQRVCGYCETGSLNQQDITALIAALNSGGDWPEGMKALRDLCENCPACILAAIVQSGVQVGGEGNGYDPPDLGFDFPKERAAFWMQHNAY